MKLRNTLLAGAAATLAMTGGAYAQTMATATADLNVRAGPGSNYEILTSIPNNGEVSVEGCTEAGDWCRVNYDGVEGFAYADYLSAGYEGEQVVVVERRDDLGIPVLGSAVSTVGNAVETTGELVGGIIRGTADTVADIVDPQPDVRDYVYENRVDPVYLRGEAVVGSSLPDDVVLYDVPDYDYQYAYVNGQPVLVDSTNRQIVYVYR